MSQVRFRLYFFLLVILAVVGLGTLGFSFAETLSPLDAFYFTMVTIATVGYGDISPVTPAGRMMAILLILLGTGAFMGVVASAMEMFLDRRESRARLAKLNMVVGVFFQEAGTDLARLMVAADPKAGELGIRLAVRARWTRADFQAARKFLNSHQYPLEPDLECLSALKALLVAKGDFLLRLMENPSLVERQEISSLVMGLLHLRDEFAHRPSLEDLPRADLVHLAGDVRRAYRGVVLQWLDYIERLKADYPYLFSLAMRLNPFDPSQSVIIRD